LLQSGFVDVEDGVVSDGLNAGSVEGEVVVEGSVVTADTSRQPPPGFGA